MSSTNPIVKNLIRQYYRQRIPAERFEAMTGFAAVTFRPGGFADNFDGRLIRRAGLAVMFTLSYESESVDGRSRLQMPLSAYAGRELANGKVARGLPQRRLNMDLRRPPRPGTRGRVIDPQRNPTLLATALRLDHACQSVVRWQRTPQRYLQLPRVLLGFAPRHAPEFLDTPALRALAAARLQIPMRKLGQNGEVLLQELLRAVWQESLLQPDDPRNDTGNLLIEADLCPGASGFLGVFEDFSRLVGAPIWNPVRNIQLRQCVNSASQVWAELGLAPVPDFEQPLSDEILAEAERRMRIALGAESDFFAREDIYDGLTEPERPLQNIRQNLSLMREKIPQWASDCCTDADLVQAALRPDQPLWLSNAARVQVVTACCLAEHVGSENQIDFGTTANATSLSNAAEVPELAVAG